MPKEPPKDALKPRAQKTTVADLRRIAKQLQTAATQLDAKAEKMKQEKIEFVMIEGRQGVEGKKGALDSLRRLLASCHRHIPDF